MRSISPVNAIIGQGRSGTTWLGAILNSHPDIAYRFEPFTRLKHTDQTIQYCENLLETPGLSDKDIPAIYTTLIKIHPLTDKPPFFPKTSVPSFGKQWIWLLARLIPFFQGAYQNLYTPKNSPPLVFKETALRYLHRLLKNTSIPVVYLVRHPCGIVLSQYQGELAGKMPSTSDHVLKSLLEQYDTSLLEQYGPVLEQMSPMEKMALRWRINTEKGVEEIRKTGKGMLLTYEQVADAPYTYSKKVFEYFNLTYEAQTDQFLHQLYAIKTPSIFHVRKEDWMDDYFTVYRNPKQQKDLWKSKLSPDDRKRIENIVRGSKAFEICASLGGWE